MTVEQCVQVTPEESERLLARPLVRVEGFPIPDSAQRRWRKSEADDWEFSRNLLLLALKDGGELFSWDIHENHASSQGYVVIRDGTIIARMETEYGLSDPPH